MSWSIQQVARLSGVTARTLRYYDEIGLLRPARVGANGYRYYDREQLLRLQQILLLRELGLDLTTIRGVADAEHDPVETLRHHHRRLLTHLLEPSGRRGPRRTSSSKLVPRPERFTT
jgi:DNA-binding transcriptional MerR regulator